MLKKQTLNMFNSALAALLCCLISIAPSAAANGTYGPREVEYVTDSRNSDVVFYVICLEREFGNTPRSMNRADALTSAERACRNLARRLPNRRSEPSATDLRQAILDCGFTSAGATRGKRCGSRNSGGGNNSGGGSASGGSQADNVVLRPKVYRLGANVKGLAYDGKWLWAAESGRNSIAQIDLDRGRYLGRINIGQAPQHVVSDRDGNTFTTLADDKSVWRQRANGQGANLANLYECPVSMVADGRSVWVLTQPDCDDRSSRLMNVNARSGRIDESNVLEEQANDLVARRNQIWIAHAGSPNLTIINQRNMRDSTMRIRRAKFSAIAANRDHVYAAGSGLRRSSDGLVVMIDPDREREVERVELPEKVAHIAVDGDYVIAVGEEGTIWLLSVDDLKLLRTITVRSGSYTPGDVLVEDDLLLVSVDQYRRRDGAVFAFSDWKPDSQSSGGNSGSGSGNGSGGGSAGNSGGNSGGSSGGGNNASIFPVRAGSSGGRVRSGPGISYGQVGSLQNGEHVTLVERTSVVMNGFPWFEIQFRGGQNGYQWGGILCETRRRVPGVNGRCKTRSTNNNQGNSGNSGSNNNNSGNNGNVGNQGNNNNSGNSNSGNQNIDLNNVLGAIIGVVGAIQDHKQQKKKKKKQRALNSCHLRGTVASTSSSRARNIQFTNVGNTDLHVYWANFQGNEGNFSNQRRPIVTLAPGTSRKLDGFVGYSFVLLDSSSNCVDVLKVTQQHTQFAVASGAKTVETNKRTVRKKITQNSSCNLRGNVVSTSNGQNAKLSITNKRRRDIDIYWISYSGQEENYGGAARPQVTIAPGNVANIDAFVGFKFVATNKRGRCLGLNEISKGISHFEFR